VNILTLPKVTTLSGRQAQVKRVNVRYVVTDLDLYPRSFSNATTGALNGVQPKPIAELFELGPVVDVVPYVQADGHTIQMTVIPNFQGVPRLRRGERAPCSLRSEVGRFAATHPAAIFRLRQMVSTVIARDGQTVVLVGGSDQLLANPNKNEPLREGTKAPQQPKKTKLPHLHHSHV